MTTPVQGNDSYTQVINAAEQIADLTLGGLKAASGAVDGDFKAGSSVSSAALLRVPADKTLLTATLFTEGSAWWTAGAGNAKSLVTASGGSTHFTFAAASTVVGVAVNPTTAFASAGAATVQLGVAAADTAATNLINLATVGSLAPAGSIVSVSNGAASTLGGTGAAVGVAAASGNNVTVHTLTADLTAGVAEVTVYYYEN